MTEIWLFPTSRLRFGGNFTKISFSFLYLFLTLWPFGAILMTTITSIGFFIMYFGGWDNIFQIYKDIYLEDYLFGFTVLCILSVVASIFLSFVLVLTCIRRHKLDTMIRLLTFQHCRVDEEYTDDDDEYTNEIYDHSKLSYKQLY